MDELPGARREYLLRLDRALQRSDWHLLWYCLMGTHVHLGMQSGEQPLDGWTRALNGGFAAWVNRRGRASGRTSRGPIIADRPASIMIPDDRAGFLAAYIHNNPVRAGIVARAIDSDWSSHRAMVRGSTSVARIDIARALEVCGCSASSEGREAFDTWVDACAPEPRNPEISGLMLRQARARLREQHGSATEVATPRLTMLGIADFPPKIRSSRMRPAATAPAAELVSHVASELGVGVEALRSRARSRSLSDARRLAVLACRAAHRPLTEVCAVLCISDSAASYCIRTADDVSRRRADDIAERWTKQR